MSRSKKDSIFLEGGVIHERDMLAYLNNQLSAEEKQQFEKLLKADPFAQEALEGLQAAQNEAAVATALTSIHKKVRERTGLKDKKGFGIHWSNYAWAAVLLGLLVGIGFVMVNFIGNRDNNIASNQGETGNTNLFETEQEIKPADIPVTIIPDSIVSVQQIQVDTAVTATTKIAEPAELISTKEDAGAKAKVEVTNTVSAESASKPKQSEKPSADAAKKQESTSVTVPATQKVVRGAIVEKEETNQVTVISMDDAMKNFNSGNYKKSSEQFDAILQQQPNNADALYFGGISEYINGNPRKSEKNFDKLLKEGSKFAEGSKWYKANILIQKGKREEARKLLDELAQSNGSYKERAIKKKAEIEF